MIRSLPAFVLFAALTMSALPAAAACSPAAADALAAARLGSRPAEVPLAEGDGMAEGACMRDLLVARLTPHLGALAGWKAGLTSAAVQARFGVEEPVLGALLDGMLLADGATVAVADGVRPLFEADLLVVIASPAIMEATTPEEAIRHIAGVRPFLELPDLALAQGSRMDGPVLTAINVGAWKGVAGPLVEIPRDATGLAMLAGMTARLTDAGGAVLSEAPGSAVLGQPMNAVLWVAARLRAEGRSLEAGQVVSIGSIGPLHPMKAGMAVTLTYEGLPGTPAVSARFE